MQVPSHEEKLSEAAFFLDVFEALQLRGESMTHGRTQQTEAAYLFSAILGAFYAALDQWHRRVGNHSAYQAFKKENPEIHGSTEQGGWRSTTVHLTHVAIAETQQAPTLAVDAHVKFGRSKLVERDDVPFANLQVHFPEYCVTYRGRSTPVLIFCREHLHSLRQLLSPGSPQGRK
jgi:hypothetical protein